MIKTIHSCDYKKSIITCDIRVKSHIYSFYAALSRTLKQHVEMPGNLISALPVSVE